MRKLPLSCGCDIGRGSKLSVVVVALLCAVCFSPYLILGKVLAPLDIKSEMLQPWRTDNMNPKVHNHFVVDAVLHYIPYRLLAERAFKEDGYVGWNPLLFGGTPQYANTMLINYDWSVLLHRFISFWDAWTIGRLGQFLIAGLGMLVFLTSRGCSQAIAALGATAFMLNHQFVAWIYFNQIVASFCWVPFILWATHKALERSPRYLAAAACFLALAILGSTLQQVAFLVAVLFCVFAGFLVEAKGWPARRRIIVTFAVIGLLGAGLTAFTLESAVHAYLDNARTGHGRGGFFYEAGAMQPLLHLLASPFTLFPSILGSVSTLDLWKIFRFDSFNIGFFGSVPMALAGVALFSRRAPVGAKLLMLAGVLVPLSPLVGYVYHRFSILWVLGGCWASCAWLASASQEELRRVASWMTRFLGFFIILWLVMSLGILSKRANLVEQLQEKVSAMASTSLFGIFADWMDARAAGLVDYIVIWNPWQIAMIVGLLLSIWGLTQLKSSQVRQFTAAAGVAMQLSVSWWQWTTWSDRLNIDPEPVLGALLRSELGNTGRLSTEQGPWAENVFTPNTLMPAGVPVANGYDAIQPHGMKSPSGLPWEFPGVTHFLGKIINRAPNGWIEVWNDGEWRLLRRPEQSVGWIRMEHGEKPMLRDRFARPTLNTMEAEVPVGTAGLTLFSNWHRGWRWKEGATGAWKPAECSPIRSVQVVFDKPLVADSTIYFRFDPASPAWVMVVSGLSILGVAWTGMFMRMRMD